MGEGPDVVEAQIDVMVADGPAQKPGYTDTSATEPGVVRKKRRGGDDIAKHLRGDSPTFSGYFGVASKKVTCLRCDEVFVSKSRENRICHTCRAGTEALVVGTLMEGGLQPGLGASTPLGGTSPGKGAGMTKTRSRMRTEYRRRG